MASLGNSAAASSSVKSAIRTLDIIEYIVAADRPLVAQEISNALSIPVSSLSYLLATLVERQYLDREGRRYTPGQGLERLQARSHGFRLADRVIPLVRSLRMQLNETVSFFVRTGWDVEAIATETSEQALRYAVPTGSHIPMHVMASGKAILAALPPEEFEAYLAQSKREKFTPSTVTSEGKLRKEIELTRKRGFATTQQELTLGIHGIGRVVKLGGEVVGAFAVAIPIVRYSDELERHAADLLIRTASLLEAS